MALDILEVSAPPVLCVPLVRVSDGHRSWPLVPPELDSGAAKTLLDKNKFQNKGQHSLVEPRAVHHENESTALSGIKGHVRRSTDGDSTSAMWF